MGGRSQQGEESDGVACVRKIFEIFPNKMYKVQIRFGSAWNGIDSVETQFNAEPPYVRVYFIFRSKSGSEKCK